MEGNAFVQFKAHSTLSHFLLTTSGSSGFELFVCLGFCWGGRLGGGRYFVFCFGFAFLSNTGTLAITKAGFFYVLFCLFLFFWALLMLLPADRKHKGSCLESLPLKLYCNQERIFALFMSVMACESFCFPL